jgi:hypothetical protein
MTTFLATLQKKEEMMNLSFFKQQLHSVIYGSSSLAKILIEDTEFR